MARKWCFSSSIFTIIITVIVVDFSIVVRVSNVHSHRCWEKRTVVLVATVDGVSIIVIVVIIIIIALSVAAQIITAGHAQCRVS